MSTLIQEILTKVSALSEFEQQEAFDFIEFLQDKSTKRQAKRFLKTKENQPATNTEGERVLNLLEKAGLLGCMETGDEKLSENYKDHLWGDE